MTSEYLKALRAMSAPTEEARKRLRRAREKQLMEWRSEGITYAEIGRRFGISTERVRQIYARANRLMKRAPDYYLQP